jgi:hypothetical protein
MAVSPEFPVSKEDKMQCPYCKEEVNDGALKCKHCGSDLTLFPKATNAGAADFGGMLNAAFTIWKENLGDLVILTLVFLLICWIPIANIGFIAGYTRSLLKVARGQGKAQVGDLFNAWDCFVNLFVFVLINLIIVIVLHFIPVLGTLAALALGFVTVPGAFLIIDKGRSFSDAYSWCIATIQADFVNWLIAYLVGNIIICAGAVVLFIGIILTAPLGELFIIQQYERVKPTASG